VAPPPVAPPPEPPPVPPYTGLCAEGSPFVGCDGVFGECGFCGA
jgi:hypothetical protein